jgi:peptidoglycan hydrolase CwlO-like protein
MSVTKKRVVLALLLASLVVLAGCSGSGGDAAESAADASYQATQAAGGDGGGAESGESADRSAYQSQDRALIRTGEVSLTVGDFEAARSNLTAATERRGGFVGDTAERVRGSENRTWTVGELTLRVPAENYSAVLERVKAEAEVRSASTHTKDVTDQLVDLDARLETLRAERDRLRELYESANDTETVLAVQRELSDVQTEIERIEAQRESLERQIRYSTITVELAEERPDAPATEPSAWYDTGLLAAFLESVNGVAVVLRSLAVGTAYAAPYALAFGLPAVGVVAAWQRLT